MPADDRFENDRVDNDRVGNTRFEDDRFEDELGEALRRTGDTFTTDRRAALVDAGEARGRRSLRRRRTAAVTGSVAALALVGLGGAYGGGLLGGGPADRNGTAAVASEAGPERPTSKGASGDHQVSGDELVKTFESLLPAGTKLTEPEARGADGPVTPSVSGVLDDGKGRAAITLSLNRVDPAHESSRQQVECPDEALVPHDACTTDELPDGSVLMTFQGYEYPDRRVDTKSWRAVLLSREGFLVDVSEWNAPTQKDSATTRPTPPLSTDELRSLATSEKWHKALGELPPPDETGIPGGPGADGEQPEEMDETTIRTTLTALLPKGLKVRPGKGQSGYTFVVVDDGRGRSQVEINVQPNMADAVGALTGDGDVSTLPDGTTVILRKSDGDKDVAGAVVWTADTIRKNGLRVAVSALNAPGPHAPPTRANPALTMQQLKTIALSERWAKRT
ncbi:MAG TPA: hypothetical protein VFH94_17430 [Streptomyces sp.]|nr:hypothetical protein [Streptomyces sp.]